MRTRSPPRDVTSVVSPRHLVGSPAGGGHETPVLTVGRQRMLGIRYYKAAPTTYVMQYAGGRVKREGTGLSFFYFAPQTTLVAVPVGSTDVPFIFHETTADFQSVTVQGHLTYRVTDPKKLSGVLDYSLGPDGKHLSDDPEKLPLRMTHAAQDATRGEVTR